MLRILLCFALSFTATASAGEGKPLDEEIRQLVRKLGSDSYVVRQRAEAQLLRIGVDAYVELQRAKDDSDIEISRRAERILSQFEALFIGQEHEAVRYWIAAYAFQTDLTEKGNIIHLLCDPTSDARNGEGLRTLCRIARFDESRTLRAEAVKALIASPPLGHSKQRKWYRTLRETIADPGEDELLVLLRMYVDLRCDLDELKEAAETAASAEEKRTGKPVSYPVPLDVEETVRQRVRDLTDRIAAFQANPENNEIQPGHRNDILLFYALAELQELAGMTQERDRTLAAALTVRSETVPRENPLNPGEHRPFFNHYQVARILRIRYRLHWAMRHALLVAEHGYIVNKIDAYTLVAEIYQYQKKYTEAAEYFDRATELVESEEFKAIQSNGTILSKRYRVCRTLCLAQQAADADNWEKVKEYVDQGLKDDPYELDTLILAWQLEQRRPDLAVKDQGGIGRKVDEALRNIERDIYREANSDQRRSKAIDACNQAAWLLSNTDGDYASSLALIETVIKEEPESAAYLDTLAHVYRSGKEFDKAVETQEKVVQIAPEGVIFYDALERFRKERDANRKTGLP